MRDSAKLCSLSLRGAEGRSSGLISISEKNGEDSGAEVDVGRVTDDGSYGLEVRVGFMEFEKPADEVWVLERGDHAMYPLPVGLGAGEMGDVIVPSVAAMLQLLLVDEPTFADTVLDGW